MWPFKSRQPTGSAPLLRVTAGDVELFSLAVADLPAEKMPVVELKPGMRLNFADSAGTTRSFDLSSAYDEGDRYLHLSVRVSAAFAVQPDGLLTVSRDDDPLEAFRNGARGVRLQPFMLPESAADNAIFEGKGLFARGLHYSGQITQGNVSLLCLCDQCHAGFRLHSFHAGFSQLAYFYCDGGPHTLVASALLQDAPPVLGPADLAATTRFEMRLPPCTTCSGRFQRMNPLRCPACNAPYIDFGRFPDEREREYYGNTIYGEALQRFDRPAEHRPTG
jgi:hypothetical protein